MKMMLLAATLAASLWPASATSQTIDPTPAVVTLMEFVLRDGTRLQGTVEEESADEVVFRTPAGATVRVRRADIVRSRPVAGRIHQGEFWRDDPHERRLFFAPTARSLPRGKTSVGLYGLMPFVQVGVTDRFSVGGGTPLFFGFDESNRPFWVTPKLQLLNRGDTQVATGLFHMLNGDGDALGIAYSVLTRGGADKSGTFGLGYAYDNDGGGGAVVMVGGEQRARSNLKWISENYIWKGGRGLLSGGVRFIGDRFATDVVLVAPLGFDWIGVFPAVSVVYVF